MSRKKMSKEVTKTTVTLAKIVKVDGAPTIETLPDLILIGNVSLEKAQKAANKANPNVAVTVFGVEPSTETYEMAVEDFIKHATLKAEEVATEVTA